MKDKSYQGSDSFIPKNDSKRRHRRGPRRNIYLFTIFSYVVMFSTLIASLGVFLYSKFLDSKLNEEIVALDTEIGSFNESDLEKVVKFDSRLRQVANRVQNSLTVLPIFTALEEATLDTVKLVSLELTRKDDEKIMLSSSFEAGDFDAALFQRGVYKRSDMLGMVDIVNVSRELTNTTGTDGDNVDANVIFDVVKFDANIDITSGKLAFEGVSEELANEINGIKENKDENGENAEEGGDNQNESQTNSGNSEGNG